MHRHKNCRDGRIPKSRKNYWKPKLLANVDRDKKNIKKLKKNGWKVMVVWECAINKDSKKAVNQVIKFLKNNMNK